MKKRGISPVVGTILLLVITVVIASIIIGFAIPFAEDNLSDSKKCLDVIEGIEFAQSQYNCYDTTTQAPESRTGFSIKVADDGVVGFRVALIDEYENAKSLSIKEGTQDIDLRQTGNSLDFEDPVNMPKNGEQRTYIVKGHYTKLEVSPVLEDDKVCPVADAITLEPCANTNPLTDP